MVNNEKNSEIRILIADDEVEFASTLITRLQLRKFQARMVNSGMEALAAIEEEVPDILLLDLKMPDLDGLEVLAKLRENYPHLKVVILTGHGSFEAGREGMELGAFDYIMKPVDLNRLIEIVKNACRESKA